MKNLFEEPKVEVIEFLKEDIVTSSGWSPYTEDDDGDFPGHGYGDNNHNHDKEGWHDNGHGHNNP